MAGAPPPPLGDKPAIVTQDPSGNLMVGTPVVPQAAYENQKLPPPYLYSPQPAFYAPPPLGVDKWQQAVPQAAPVQQAPPPYYYGQPTNYTPPPYAPQSAGVVPMMPSSGGTGADPAYFHPENRLAPTQQYTPSPEVTADFSDAEWRRTDRPYTGGDPTRVTHLNYFSNYLTELVNLRVFPNMLRLTVRENELRTLQGIHEAPYLRWVDASGNYIKDFRGMGQMHCLEWFDCHQNDVKTVRGLEFAPNLTWLNLHHNYLANFDGVEALPNLRFIDASDNELRDARGLERCGMLQEINLASNHLKDVASIMALANLPHLFRLNIYWNDLSDGDVARIVEHFRTVKPQCDVITDEAGSRRAGHNVEFKGRDQKPTTKHSLDEKKAGCCTVC